MNVVVTGGGGYVGSLLVRRLLERGHCVRVVDEFSDGRSSLAAIQERVELIEGDLRELDPRWLQGADGVVHLAGVHAESAWADDPQITWQANAVVTERLALACRAVKVARLVYGSTCDVYTHLPAGHEYHESVPAWPRSAFAVSKFYGELRLRQLADSSFCPVILRHATPFGLSPRAVFETLPNRFVMDAVASGRVRVPRDAWIVRPLVDVADLAEAHLCCLEAPAHLVRGQAFNVAYANVTIRDLAARVAEVVGRQTGRIQLSHTDAPAGARDCRCSPTRLWDTLGFRPSRCVEAAAEAMTRYLTESPPEVAPLPAPSRLGLSMPLRPRPVARWKTDRSSGSFTCWVE
jgi:nucleoside-diphosphate-sugar epimerase